MRVGQMSQNSVEHTFYTDSVEIEQGFIRWVTNLDSDILSAVAKHMDSGTEHCQDYYSNLNR